VLAALVLSAASCAGPPSGPDAADLSGMWAGTVPRGFYLDTMRLELVQSGRALAGQGVRGLPCPADGTCYADVAVMGTVSGSDVVLSFAPPFGDRFVGSVAPDGSLMGTLTGYSDRPQLTLSRIRE
jgi:hypothetical protein